MSSFKRASMTPAARANPIMSLKTTQMHESKAVLPAEIIATILDYLPIPDLLSFARTSKRMQEMVYEDSRWVRRLKSMGVWNDGEARKRFEDALRARREMMRIKAEEDGRSARSRTNGAGGVRKTSMSKIGRAHV